jgi:hypothetical protein
MTNLNHNRTVICTSQTVNPRPEARLPQLGVKRRVVLPGAAVSVIVSAQGENIYVSE